MYSLVVSNARKISEEYQRADNGETARDNVRFFVLVYYLKSPAVLKNGWGHRQKISKIKKGTKNE